MSARVTLDTYPIFPNVGELGYVPAVPWMADTLYSASKPISLVTRAGTTYQCILTHTSSSTFDPTKWQVFAAKGDTPSKSDIGLGNVDNYSASQLAAAGNPVGDMLAALGTAVSGKQSTSARAQPLGYMALSDGTSGSTSSINKGRAVISPLAWNPYDPAQYVSGRSNPDSVWFAVGGHLGDAMGSAGIEYQWCQETHATNAGTRAITGVDATIHGYKIRAFGATCRQSGSGGDWHSGEFLGGQTAAKLRTTALTGATTLAISGIDLRGLRVGIGSNILSGSSAGVPVGAVITQFTKDGKTYTGQGLDFATVVSPGTGATNGQELVGPLSGGGGTWTVPIRVVIRSTSGGGVSTVKYLEQGNCTVAPTGPVPFTGGGTAGVTLNLSLIPAGVEQPDTITLDTPLAGDLSGGLLKFGCTACSGYAVLLSGSGDGGPTGEGNIDGRAIGFQAYGTAAWKRLLNAGSSALRADGTVFDMTSVTGSRGFSAAACNFSDSFLYNSGGTYGSLWTATGLTCTGSMWSIGNCTALAGLNFTASNNFGTDRRAIWLQSQNVKMTGGASIGATPSDTVGFYGKQNTTGRQAAIADPSGGATIDAEARASLVSLLNALRSTTTAGLGLIT